MATGYIQKKHAVNSSGTPIAITDDATGDALIKNLPTATGFVYDDVSNTIKFSKNGVIVELVDTSSNNPTTANIGAANGATVTATETGNAQLHTTVLTLAATPLTLRDTEQGGGVKIYDFPLGHILILGSSGSVKETTTSAIATTLNAGVTYNWGIGTTTQANATLATTEQNILPTTNGTSSATINVEAATSSGGLNGNSVALDGSGTAIDAFFNVGVAGAGDIDADATTTWNGTITIIWQFLG